MRGNVLLIILVSLLVGTSIYLAVSSWKTHQQRRQKTAERGWRYTNTLLQSLRHTSYTIAGTTPNGIIWEMQRNQKKDKLLFTWITESAPLPYGLIHVLPRQASVSQQGHLPTIQLLIWQHERWQNPALSDYVIFTSHQQLGERFLTSEVALALSHWPGWPFPGALEEIKWSQKSLEIQVRYLGDWTTADRLVALGTALVSNISPQNHDRDQ